MSACRSRWPPGVAAFSGRRHTVFWTIVLTGCLLGSFGPYTPVYPALETLVPPTPIVPVSGEISVARLVRPGGARRLRDPVADRSRRSAPAADVGSGRGVHAERRHLRVRRVAAGGPGNPAAPCIPARNPYARAVSPARCGVFDLSRAPVADDALSEAGVLGVSVVDRGLAATRASHGAHRLRGVCRRGSGAGQLRRQSDAPGRLGREAGMDARSSIPGAHQRVYIGGRLFGENRLAGYRRARSIRPASTNEATWSGATSP